MGQASSARQLSGRWRRGAPLERARGRRRPRAAPRRREAPGACGAKPCGAARSRSWVAHARGRGEAARAPGAELSAAAGAKGVARWPRAATRGSWPRAQGSALWGRAEQGRQALVQDSGAVLVGRVGSSVNLCWLLVCSSACFSRGFSVLETGAKTLSRHGHSPPRDSLRAAAGAKGVARSPRAATRGSWPWAQGRGRAGTAGISARQW